MKALKHWTKAIIVDGAVFYLLYLWLVEGSEGPKNISLFLIWLSAVSRLIFVWILDRDFAEKLWRPAGFTTYHQFTDMIVVFALAWFGHTVIAAVFFIAMIVWEGGRKRALKQAKRSLEEQTA